MCAGPSLCAFADEYRAHLYSPTSALAGSTMLKQFRQDYFRLITNQLTLSANKQPVKTINNQFKNCHFKQVAISQSAISLNWSVVTGHWSVSLTTSNQKLATTFMHSVITTYQPIIQHLILSTKQLLVKYCQSLKLPVV